MMHSKRMAPPLSAYFFVLLIASVEALPIVLNADLNPVAQKGIEYLRSIGIPYISKSLLALHVPDVSGKTHSPIGDFKYTLANIRFQDVQIPKSNLTISQANGLTIAASNMTLSIDADWTYRQSGWPHLSDKGSCRIRMKHIKLQLTCNINARNETEPELHISEASIKIGHMKLKFHGGASWLYNVFADSISTDIKNNFEAEIQKQMTSTIDKEGNKVLHQFPAVIQSIQKHLREDHKEDLQDEEF